MGSARQCLAVPADDLLLALQRARLTTSHFRLVAVLSDRLRIDRSVMVGICDGLE
jgi:hypothetical protein